MLWPDMDLFFQLRGVPVAQLVEAFEDIRDNHPEIRSVALEIIGDFDGNLYRSQMDAIRPYLPGGTRSAVDFVYIGSAIPQWTSTTTSPYREGIKDWQEREKALALQLKLWRQVKDRYPDLVADPNCGLYINYEAVLEFWVADPSIRWSYEYFFKRSIVDAESIRKGIDLLWCPAWWVRTPPAGMKTLINQTWNGMLAETGRIIDRVDVEDMMGRNWIGATVDHVEQWVNTFEDTGARVAVDCELFEEPAWSPSDPQELNNRMQAYINRGLEIGHCFEFRYWQQLPHTHPVAPPLPPTVNQPPQEVWDAIVVALAEIGYEIEPID